MTVQTTLVAPPVRPATPDPASSPGAPTGPAAPPNEPAGDAPGAGWQQPSSRQREAALARSIVKTLARALPPDTPLQVSFDERVDGVDSAVPLQVAPGDPVAARVRVHGQDALARLLPPTENAFADGYLRGDIDIDGDIAVAIGAARTVDLRRLAPAEARRLLRWSIELRRSGAGGRGAPLVRRAARLSGPRHSRARDLAAIRFHYDVGEAFYRLWLDRRLTYSCAYFERDDDPARDLDAAQEAKLELICRKLDLRSGQRLLDIGCGWGSLLLHAAERHKVDAVGITLSERQADEANRRARLMGLGHRARAEVRDYRDLAELGPFDAIASIGMFEHVGAAMLPGYFEAAFRALVPGGRFLNHGIASATRGLTAWPASAEAWHGGLRRATFTERYVFPDGELVPVERAVAVARDTAGFEVLDLQSLRPHYALTLQAWVQRLEESWHEAVAAAGEEVARTWRLYMAGARTGFERGELDVVQLLLARPAGECRPAPRPLRPWW